MEWSWFSPPTSKWSKLNTILGITHLTPKPKKNSSQLHRNQKLNKQMPHILTIVIVYATLVYSHYFCCDGSWGLNFFFFLKTRFEFIRCRYFLFYFWDWGWGGGCVGFFWVGLTSLWRCGVGWVTMMMVCKEWVTVVLAIFFSQRFISVHVLFVFVLIFFSWFNLNQQRSFKLTGF